MRPITYLLLSFVCFTSCGTTAHIQKTWRDPEVTVDMAKLKKVLIVALLKNETNRHVTEDQLVALLKGKGVASYNYLTKDIQPDKEEIIRQKLRDEGFDGIVIMRLADVDKDVKYVPGSFNTYPLYYSRFWGYYRNAGSNFYQQGYYETTKTFTVETNVYSLLRDKLIWSGLTNSVNPSNVEKLTQATAKAVYNKMKQEGFLID